LPFETAPEELLITLISKVAVIREKNIKVSYANGSSKDVTFSYRGCTFAILPSANHNTIRNVEVHLEISSQNHGRISDSFFREAAKLLHDLE